MAAARKPRPRRRDRYPDGAQLVYLAHPVVMREVGAGPDVPPRFLGVHLWAIDPASRFRDRGKDRYAGWWVFLGPPGASYYGPDDPVPERNGQEVGFRKHRFARTAATDRAPAGWTDLGPLPPSLGGFDRFGARGYYVPWRGTVEALRWLGGGHGSGRDHRYETRPGLEPPPPEDDALLFELHLFPRAMAAFNEAQAAFYAAHPAAALAPPAWSPF